jgi:hypothetical protein
LKREVKEVQERVNQPLGREESGGEWPLNSGAMAQQMVRNAAVFAIEQMT